MFRVTDLPAMTIAVDLGRKATKQPTKTWRSGVRSAMRAASQLPGKGPTDVDNAPAPAR